VGGEKRGRKVERWEDLYIREAVVGERLRKGEKLSIISGGETKLRK